jgi:hypothetical protein
MFYKEMVSTNLRKRLADCKKLFAITEMFIKFQILRPNVKKPYAYSLVWFFLSQFFLICAQPQQITSHSHLSKIWTSINTRTEIFAWSLSIFLFSMLLLVVIFALGLTFLLNILLEETFRIFTF